MEFLLGKRARTAPPQARKFLGMAATQTNVEGGETLLSV